LPLLVWSAPGFEEPVFWTDTLCFGEEDSVGRQGGPGRRGYSAEFRRRVIDLLDSGRKVADVARDLGVSEQAIYGWRRQERIDRGLDPGLSTLEQAELAAAKRRIRELEAELAVHRRAAELLQETSRPKGASRPLA
jgi:transposase